LKITENTPIALGVVISAVGAIAWLTHIAWVSESNAEALKVVVGKQEVYTDSIAEIKKDIAVIKRILQEER